MLCAKHQCKCLVPISISSAKCYTLSYEVGTVDICHSLTRTLVPREPKVCMARGMAESDTGSESGYCSSGVTSEILAGDAAAWKLFPKGMPSLFQREGGCPRSMLGNTHRASVSPGTYDF